MEEYEAANEWIRKRTNLPTLKSSLEISRDFEAKLRAQAFFSARVAEGHILDRLRNVSDAYSRGEIGLAEARTALKKFLRAEGKDDGTNGLRNLASTARLNLILTQNARMAAAVGRYQVSMDPDIKERWPCWRYIGSSAANPRDSHARYAGKVYRKDDPIWHKIYPPSDFGCQCDVEDCDDPPDDAPKKVETAESGFEFDPAHAFEEFDLSSIRDAGLREKTKQQMKIQFGAGAAAENRNLPIEKALQATEKDNLAIFGENYLNEEKRIREKADRIQKKLDASLEGKEGMEYLKASQRGFRHRARLRKAMENTQINLCAETLGRVIPVKASIKADSTKAVTGVTKQIKNVLEKCVSGDIINQDMVLSVDKVPRATIDARAYYSPGKKKLYLNTHPGAYRKLSTGLHESMHWLEDFNRHVHRRCIEFLEYRCKGETPQSLRRLTGLGYEADEMARRDKFFNPYCGKEYVVNGNRYATEILSMGMERVMKEPIVFAKEDPEYFNFVVSILKGEV